MAALPAPPPAAVAPPPAPRPRAPRPPRPPPPPPPDAHLLDEVLAGLSPHSRYTRFHGPKPRLSSSERAYLSATDERNHLALVASDPEGGALGIARAVRLRAQPGPAEGAAEVIDARQ